MSLHAPDVRDETPSDHEPVAAIHREAFGRPAEAGLVEALRRSERPFLSLVALRRGRIAGHVFLSPVRIEGTGAPPPAAGLGPLAVRPEDQRRGVGSALVRAALARAPSLGWHAVFLLGDPDYYGRFGFALAAGRGLRYESEHFDAAFQVIEVSPGALSGCTGWVRYPAAFSEL